MLLRSSSSPIPSSCLPQYLNSRDYPSPESDPTLRIPRTSSLSLTTSKNCVPHGVSRRNSQKSTSSKIEESDDEAEEGPVQKSFIELFSSSGLDKTVGKHEESSAMEGGIGSNGWGGGHGSRWGQSNEEDGTDSYYQKMIQANPNNPLFLANYASLPVC